MENIPTKMAPQDSNQMSTTRTRRPKVKSTTTKSKSSNVQWTIEARIDSPNNDWGHQSIPKDGQKENSKIYSHSEKGSHEILPFVEGSSNQTLLKEKNQDIKISSSHDLIGSNTPSPSSTEIENDLVELFSSSHSKLVSNPKEKRNKSTSSKQHVIFSSSDSKLVFNPKEKRNKSTSKQNAIFSSSDSKIVFNPKEKRNKSTSKQHESDDRTNSLLHNNTDKGGRGLTREESQNKINAIKALTETALLQSERIQVEKNHHAKTRRQLERVSSKLEEERFQSSVIIENLNRDIEVTEQDNTLLRLEVSKLREEKVYQPREEHEKTLRKVLDSKNRQIGSLKSALAALQDSIAKTETTYIRLEIEYEEKLEESQKEMHKDQDKLFAEVNRLHGLMGEMNDK
eukprot:scaffold4810_cov38-Attheya_sp.AAC.1